MKLRNSTTWSDTFLRRMVGWCCREVGYPASRLREAQFRNRTRKAYSGHAYSSRRIVASVGPAARFPLKPDSRPGMGNEAIADREEALIAITAHELAHLLQYRDGRSGVLDKQRKSEFDARWHEVRALRAFRANREALLSEWAVERAIVVRPVASIQEKRSTKAQADLARWQRKLKLAQTKVRKLKQRAAYYERTLAAKAAQ